MRRTGISARIFVAVVLAGLIPAALIAGSLGRPYSPDSFALRHSVGVIGPNARSFEGSLESNFPSLSDVNHFQQVKPLLAIVQNNTKRVVKAYVIKWTIINSDGSNSAAYLTVVQEPLDQWTLTGQRTVLGPTGTNLVSPFFHWNKGEFPVLLHDGAVEGTISAVTSQEPLVVKAKGAVSIKTVLDGAVFGDGVFVGPDTSKLYERFQAEQKAEVQEGKWMLDKLNSDATEQQIRGSLSEHIYEGRNAAAGITAASLYAASRGEEATRLLSVLEQGGLGRLRMVATRLAGATPLVLRKLAEP